MCLYTYFHYVYTEEPLHPLCGRSWQIRIDRISYVDAKGPMYGRYRAEQFYSGEDYMLQIDAHTLFVTHWDNIVIDMMKRTQNPYAVLTTYPKATGTDLLHWRAPISVPDDGVVAICQTKQLPSSHFMFKHERGIFIINPGKPVLTPFFAAGFSFSRGHRILNVPADPYLPYLFDGEEMLMSTRLWTHGYDLYLPDRDVIYHIYESDYQRPLFWNDDWSTLKRKAVLTAQNRINYILQLYDRYPRYGKLDLREIEKYSLGKQRNITQYWNWLGFDFDKFESLDHCDNLRLGKLQRIPTVSD
ncbi:hypothetical protein RFI_11591 [Reticulomyxa filosa]|uniref:Uncharacterized protein n=1 Tax=Reticulomyxa filosa TaxID=46433 RepID=X6NJL6_RETFI|nr:hypothetical protein RFI_11591 [Reticulomyxa filosa]|eukprot:ETO25547.1 hypothetical protein RFI_11591 [Reticulomyxa filosa]